MTYCDHDQVHYPLRFVIPPHKKLLQVNQLFEQEQFSSEEDLVLLEIDAAAAAAMIGCQKS